MVCSLWIQGRLKMANPLENTNYTPGNPTTLLEDDINNNIFMGNTCGNSTLSGFSNAGFGTNCMSVINNSQSNAAFGTNALANITAAAFDFAFGTNALSSLTDGQRNFAGGYNSLTSVVSNNDNVGLGDSTLSALAGGNGNTAIGSGAGDLHTGLTNCTFLGFSSHSNVDSLSNATAIGYNSRVSNSNTLILGDNIFGTTKVGIGTLNPSSLLHIVNGTGLALNVQGGLQLNYVGVISDPYPVQDNDCIVGFATIAHPFSVILPSPLGITGRIIVIKDGGHAATNNITITSDGGGTIDGAASLVINTNYRSVVFFADGGSNWFVMSTT